MTDVEPPDLTLAKRLLDACKHQGFVCQRVGTGEATRATARVAVPSAVLGGGRPLAVPGVAHRRGAAFLPRLGVAVMRGSGAPVPTG